MGAASGLRSGGRAGFAAGAACFAGAAAPSPSAAILATTVFTCTVVPSETLISCNTPDVGDGISASTLSVEISNSGSSRCTFSPGFFSHLVIVPSKMDSPICGMTMSVGIIPFPAAHGSQYWAGCNLRLYMRGSSYSFELTGVHPINQPINLRPFPLCASLPTAHQLQKSFSSNPLLPAAASPRVKGGQ